MNPATRLAVAAVRAYRRFVSPLKPPTCRFQPTCSAYALDAYRLHGFLRGSRLTLWRILRCQPFARGGWDPVPGGLGLERGGADGGSSDEACSPRPDADTAGSATPRAEAETRP